MSTDLTNNNDTVYHRTEKFFSAKSTLSISLLTDGLISFSSEVGASDLHLNPTESGVSVRIRIDGHLRTFDPLPKGVHEALIARLKVLAGLRTDEHFVPQDGRFRHQLPDFEWLDIRLSIAPTYFGENAVLRFLKSTETGLNLEKLGIAKQMETQIKETLTRAGGLVLVTGPTGSGKTTTLYAFIQLILNNPLSLVTIEDPVEYSIPGAVQIQIRAGDIFANTLRGVLRQDPNVIMVGEIRDAETAALVTNSALTGHLVLSTLHAKDAPSTLLRLMDLGVAPYLIASTVSLIVAQRLVRMVCISCAYAEKISSTEHDYLSRHMDVLVPETLVKGRGCSACDGSGYRGRIGVYEFLTLNEELVGAVLRKATGQELSDVALRSGMQPLLSDGFSKVLSGSTTMEEILRLPYG